MDSMLGGGICTMSITEVFGEFRRLLRSKLTGKLRLRIFFFRLWEDAVRTYFECCMSASQGRFLLSCK